MRQSTRFADAIHLLAYVYLQSGEEKITSKVLAGSINVTPVNVRQITGQLREAGLISTTSGSGKITFNKPIDQINLLEIFDAVTDGSLFHRDNQTNPECKVGSKMPDVLDDEFDLIENQARTKMSEITLAEVVSHVKEAQLAAK